MHDVVPCLPQLPRRNPDTLFALTGVLECHPQVPVLMAEQATHTTVCTALGLSGADTLDPARVEDPDRGSLGRHLRRPGAPFEIARARVTVVAYAAQVSAVPEQRLQRHPSTVLGHRLYADFATRVWLIAHGTPKCVSLLRVHMKPHTAFQRTPQ